MVCKWGGVISGLECLGRPGRSLVPALVRLVRPPEQQSGAAATVRAGDPSTRAFRKNTRRSSPYPRPARADGGKSVIRIDRFILSHGSHTTPTPISRDKTQMSGAPHLPTQDFCRQVSRSASSTLPGAVLSLPLRVAGLPSTTYTTDNNNGTLTPITNAPRPPRRPARRAHARTHQGPGPDRARPRAQPQEAQASAHRRGQAGSRTARKYSC